MSISHLPLASLVGTLPPCPCGKGHTLTTRAAAVVDDAPAALAAALDGARGPLLLLCDENTYDVLGEKAHRTLSPLGRVDTCILTGGALHADEAALGAAMMALGQDVTRVVACGSGTINDIARYLASRARIPYDVLGTAPSMDGYVSSVSPLIRDGFKITFEAAAPQHAFLDLPTMQAAPMAMLAAGLGDVLGKYTALADWLIAREVYGEYHCAQTAQLMQRAVDLCASSAPRLVAREPDAIRQLGEGLLLAGMAMQMVGNSRPASGCEHHLAHFWEMRQMARGEKPTLHGDKVGYAELLMLTYYEKFFAEKRPFGQVDAAAWQTGMQAAFGPLYAQVMRSSSPDGAPDEAARTRAAASWDVLKAASDSITGARPRLHDALIACCGPTTYQQLGLTRDDVRDALLYAKEVRPRTSVLRLAHAWGVHQQIVDEIMEGLDDQSIFAR